MKSQEVYNDLLRQYEQLSLEEKAAILIYKSQLYNILNAMSSIPGFMNMDENELLSKLDKETLINIFEKYKEIVFMNENITTRYTIFSNIDFTNIITCMKSLKQVYKLIQQTKGKIKLKDKLTVYRGISLDIPNTPTTLSRGDIISTGLKLDDAFTFLLHHQYNHLYVIELEAGTNVLVTPYALITTYPKDENHLENLLKQKNPNILKIMKLGSTVQEEIIIFQSELEFEETLFKIKYLEGYDSPINTHYLKAYPKQLTKDNIK